MVISVLGAATANCSSTLPRTPSPAHNQLTHPRGASTRYGTAGQAIATARTSLLPCGVPGHVAWPHSPVVQCPYLRRLVRLDARYSLGINSARTSPPPGTTLFAIVVAEAIDFDFDFTTAPHQMPSKSSTNNPRMNTVDTLAHAMQHQNNPSSTRLHHHQRRSRSSPMRRKC